MASEIDPFPEQFYTGNSVGKSSKERYQYFKNKIDNWDRVGALPNRFV